MDGASLPILKIGALVVMNSSIGAVALNAMQLAIDDVNADESVLPDFQLSLEAMDSSCSAFQGAVSGSTTLPLTRLSCSSFPWLPILPILCILGHPCFLCSSLGVWLPVVSSLSILSPLTFFLQKPFRLSV